MSSSPKSSNSGPDALFLSDDLSHAEKDSSNSQICSSDGNHIGSFGGQVAICGFGLRLPGGIRNGDDFWDVLINGKDARGPIPASRYNSESFDNSLGARDAIKVKHGYFLDEDLSALDTSFFTLTKNELENCDPQQRMLLEVTRECLEEAGEVNYRGQLIGCYVGTFGDDWLLMGAKDSQHGDGYSMTGHLDLMIANRISYEYDFRGPSMAIKTGCSASLAALHEAVRAIQNGDASAAIVAGTSLIMTPALTSAMTSLDLLSPEGSCKTFDAAADGFARAEAISAVYIKSLGDALRDGNPIRAIIRGTATNSDGKGQSLVIPNGDAQEALIRKAYADSGLEPSETAFVECHGTGTAKGDPIETTAVGKVWANAGVYIGSVKPNLGHSEGASGISSLIKSVLALEHKMIPPNIKFKTPNPKIAFSEYNLTVPVVPTPFPPHRAERVSINSFGIGGANVHVILDSFHQATSSDAPTTEAAQTELILLSANTETALKEQISRHQEYIQSNPRLTSDVAYTCALHREHLPHRSFLIVENENSVELAPGLKASQTVPVVNMVFGGQGAQWPEMGKELILADPEFREDILKMGMVMKGLKFPPDWNLMDELLKPPETSQINKSELSQPLCTALQVALYNKFTSLGVEPTAVIGHSSGEIAAAYAAGYISMEEAIVIAYYRGYITRHSSGGSMAAIGLDAQELSGYLSQGVELACENSPNSSTISGDSEKIREVVDAIKQKLPDTLARVLKVDLAYHSGHMLSVSKEYHELLEEELKNLKAPREEPTAVLVSSVTCKAMDGSPISPSYWITNLLFPVRFSSAVSNLVGLKGSGILLEIGPHSTLAGPLRQICAANSQPYNYISAMVRGKNSTISFLSAVGKLYQEGVQMNLGSLYPTGKAIAGLPTYPWDHKTAHWSESRVSKAWRGRTYPQHCLLGSRILEAADIEPQWRNVLRVEDEPWLADHKIHTDIVFPFAGYIALAGEAIRQITHSTHDVGYRLRHVVAHTALVLSYSQPTELITSLRRRKLTDNDESDWFDFSIMSCSGSTWIKHCDGRVTLLKDARPSSWKSESMSRNVSSSRFYDEMAKIGFIYGPKFQGLTNISSSTTEEIATSDIVDHNKSSRNIFTLHPAAIDACLQLLIISMSKGLLRNLIDLSVPTVIEELEISSGTDIIHARACKQFGGSKSTFLECVAEGKTVLRASGIQLQPLEDDKSSEEEDIYAAARLQWLPHFEFVDISKLITPPKSDRVETRLIEELVLLLILETAAKIEGLTPCQPHFAKFREWLNKQIDVASTDTYDLIEDSERYVKLSSVERQSMINERLTPLMQMGRNAVTTGLKRIFDNAEKMFTGETETLEVLLKDNILARTYDVIGFDLGPFVRSLAHTRPNLRILEVGAGTGGTTESVLRSLTTPGGLPAHSMYTFTDISAGFFPTAKERFSYASNLEFKIFDISKEPFEQGFKESSYDLIIATNVIHATPVLRETLKNLQPLLRSDGMLVMTEICSTSRAPGYTFGNFSGWWLGESDGRKDQPHVSMSRWDEELKASGFTGLDATVSDDEEPYRQCVVIVSGKKNTAEITKKKNVTILSANSEGQLAQSLADFLLARDWVVAHCRLGDNLPRDQDIISCLDVETNFFENITEESLIAFQALLRSMGTNKLLWLTGVTQVNCRDPRAAQTLGVTRTIRSELALQFHTLEINTDEPHFTSLVTKVFTKIREQEDRDNIDSDREFVVDNSIISVGRFHPFSLVEEVRVKSNEKQKRTMKYLEVETPGIFETLAWRSEPLPDTIPENHVDIEVAVVGVNFRDVTVVAGLFSSGSSDRSLGQEIAGTVKRLGQGVSGFAVGDRVMAITPAGGFQTNVILEEQRLVKIPDEMSFKEAATIQVTFGTVVHSLLDIGRLSSGQSVLIHSACGGVGLAAVQVCQMMGAEIFATVGNDEKKEYLVNNCGIPRQHIFSSRDSSFYDGIMRETAGVGVDLVLNSLAGELLHASWRCVTPTGAFLELGKRDMAGSGQLDMRPFLDNRSFRGVDMLYYVSAEPLKVRSILQRVLEFYQQRLLKPIHPITQFAAADVKRAFRQLQAGEHIGKLVVNMPTNSNELESSLSTQRIQFRSDAAYLLVGGTGGLGRSLATWMVERGARNLVFLSRSAGLCEESASLANELESMGCSITMIGGSVDNIDDVKRAVAASKVPIKGVFQLAMVQRDCPFIDMSWSDWNTVNKPKVEGTWNLHNIFLGHDLDFFWMASSIATVIDQSGQGNYKAATTFLEAFSQYRHSIDLPASVLTICPIDNVGFFTENPWAVRVAKSQGQYFLGEKEFLDYMEASLLNSSPKRSTGGAASATSSSISSWEASGQIVMGLRSDLHLDDPKNPTNWRRDCRMGLYHNIPREEVKASETDLTRLTQFLKSVADDESGSILADEASTDLLAFETGRKIHDFLLKPDAEVDLTLSLAQIGLDSLTAIELRRWFRQAFGLQISVLEIMGSGSLRELGRVIAKKLGEKHGHVS